MNKLKLCIVIITAMLFSESYSQENNKFSLGYVISKPEKSQGDFLLNGLEFEYSRFLNKSLSLSANIEFDRHNNFPKFVNGGMNTGLNPNPELLKYIYTNVRSAGGLWTKVNQSIYSINLNYFPINKKHHNLYITGGFGINIQDALEYGIESARIKYYENGTTELVNYTDFYSQRSSNTIICQTGVGYDYLFLNSNWFIGTNLRLQFPIKRDDFFFKHGGFGFDETLRLGIKIGKKF